MCPLQKERAVSSGKCRADWGAYRSVLTKHGVVKTYYKIGTVYKNLNEKLARKDRKSKK